MKKGKKQTNTKNYTLVGVTRSGFTALKSEMITDKEACRRNHDLAEKGSNIHWEVLFDWTGRDK